MRKLTTLLMLLLLCNYGAFGQLAPSHAFVSVGEQVVSSNDIVDGEIYLIKSKGLTVEATATSGRQFAQERTDGIIRFALPSGLDADCLFRLVSDGNGGFYIQANSGNWFKGIAVANDDATSTVAESERAAFTFDGTGTDGEFRIHNNGHRENIGGGGNPDPTLKPGKDTSDSDWSIFYIYKATIKVPFTVSTEGNETWYMLRTKANHVMYVSGGKVPAYTGLSTRNKNTRFAIYGSYQDGFKIKSQATGNYIHISSNLSTGWSWYASLGDATLFNILEADGGFYLETKDLLNTNGGHSTFGYSGSSQWLGGKNNTFGVWTQSNFGDDGIIKVYEVGIPDLSTISNNKCYTLTAYRGRIGMKNNKLSATPLKDITESDQDKFAIISFNGNYYLWSVADSKFVVPSDKDGVESDFPSASFILSGDAPFFCTMEGRKSMNVANDGGSASFSTTWTTPDEGNLYAIKEAGDFDPTVPLAFLNDYYNFTYILQDETGAEITRLEKQHVDVGTTITVNNLPTQLCSGYDATDYNYTPFGPVEEGVHEAVITRTLKEDPNKPSLPTPFFMSFGEKAATLQVAESAEDNDHWYLVTQVRNGESPLRDAGTYSQLRRASTSVNNSSLTNKDATENAQYLVRFFDAGDGLYTMQFANGNYITSDLTSAQTIYSAGKFAFYNTTEGGTGYGWNLNSNTGQRVDNNGAGNTVAYWGSGLNTSTSGNNVWHIYPVEQLPSVSYVVKDTEENVIFTSSPVASTTGATITSLPETYQLEAFYTYNTIEKTITDIVNTAEFVATPKTDSPLKYSADTTNPVYYNLKIRGKYLVYNTDEIGEVSLQDESEPFNPAASWALIGDNAYNLQLINKSKGEEYRLVYSSVVTAKPSSNNIVFQTVSDAAGKYWAIDTNTGGFVLRMKENPNIYFHHENGATKYLRTCSLQEWSYVHNDEGSTIVATSDTDELISLYNDMKNREYGDNVNQYSTTAEGGVMGVQSTIAAVGQVIDNENTVAYADAYYALKAIKEASTLNLPTPGFYRIKSYAQNAYVSSRVDETVAESYRTSYTDNNDATDPGTIWYYDGTGLLNYSTGLYTSNRMAAAVGNTGSTVTFSEATNGIGKYWIKPSGANYWYAGVPTLDNYSAPATVENTLFTLEPVSELKVSLTPLSKWGVEGNYTTLYMPVAVKISEEATAYAIVKNADGVTLDMVACPDNVVPANTGVILNGNYAQCTATLSTEAGTATSDLTGTTPMIGTVDGCYVLSVVNGKLGFYKFVGTELKGFRAYYVDETADPTRGFVLNMGDLTGINPSLLTGDASQVYDLQGRRVLNAQKGLYIINGKKVVK
ncbi:MAG: hypothetical protein SPL50_05480 [Alloprevotella sp.]|nr:hypothetical protein [Alloprevotella sp.]